MYQRIHNNNMFHLQLIIVERYAMSSGEETLLANLHLDYLSTTLSSHRPPPLAPTLHCRGHCSLYARGSYGRNTCLHIEAIVNVPPVPERHAVACHYSLGGLQGHHERCPRICNTEHCFDVRTVRILELDWHILCIACTQVGENINKIDNIGGLRFGHARKLGDTSGCIPLGLQ
jgi:hypothetical protein